MPPELEGRRMEFARAVVEAQLISDAFAREHHWQAFAEAPAFESVEIYASQDELWKRVIGLTGLPPDAAIPSDGFAAGIVADVLVAVTPQEYRKLRPEYAARKGAWVLLLAHEIIHQLHQRIVGGDEKAMGPRWFYEGFATRGAGQHLGGEEIRTMIEARTAMRAEGRGSYARFEQALRFFERRIPLRELVRRSGQQDFETWLSTLETGPSSGVSGSQPASAAEAQNEDCGT